MDWIKYYEQLGTATELEPLPHGIVADIVSRKIINFKKSTENVNSQTLMMYLNIERKKEFKVHTSPFPERDANNPYLIRPQLEADGIYQDFLNMLEARLKKTPPLKKFDHFSDSFIQISDWVEIKNKLIEKKYFSDSGKWQDFKSGYLKVAASFIKWVAANGYCVKTKFTVNEIQLFCINDLGFDEISESTIKHAPSELPRDLSLPPKT